MLLFFVAVAYAFDVIGENIIIVIVFMEYQVSF